MILLTEHSRKKIDISKRVTAKVANKSSEVPKCSIGHALAGKYIF